MIEDGLFGVVTDRDESLQVFAALSSAFAKSAKIVPNCLVGWQGGKARVDAYWSSGKNVWGVFRELPPEEGKPPSATSNLNRRERFWNCFGLGKPKSNQMLQIVVELNPPREGLYGRTAGVFLRGEDGNYYVGHSGRVGGGRKGIRLKAFKEFAVGLEWKEVSTMAGLRELTIFGPITDDDFVDKVAEFVRIVSEFKESVTA